jgi:hypothetical protein
MTSTKNAEWDTAVFQLFVQKRSQEFHCRNLQQWRKSLR